MRNSRREGTWDEDGEEEGEDDVEKGDEEDGGDG